MTLSFTKTNGEGGQLDLDTLKSLSENSGNILCLKPGSRYLADSIKTLGGGKDYDRYPILFYYVDQYSSNNDLYTVCKNLMCFVNTANNFNNNNYASIAGYYDYTEICYICNYMYRSGSRWYSKIQLKNISSDVMLSLDEKTASTTSKITRPLCVLGVSPYFQQR